MHKNHLTVIAFGVVIATALYLAQKASNLQNQVAILNKQESLVYIRLRSVLQEHNDLAKRLAGPHQISRLNSDHSELLKLQAAEETRKAQESQTDSADPFTASVFSLAKGAAELNGYFERMPDKEIPELSLLTEVDWLQLAKDIPKPETQLDIRKALSQIREKAKRKFIGLAQPALSEFAEANNKQMPSDPIQLKAYLKEPVDDAVLQRYQIINGNDLPSGPEYHKIVNNQPVMVEKSPADMEFDYRHFVYSTGSGVGATQGSGRYLWKSR